MSGPIALPEDPENGTGDVFSGVGRFFSRVGQQARTVVVNTKAELVMRAFAVISGIVTAALMGVEQTAHPHDRGYGFSFFSPWPTVFIGLAHLLFQPLLSSLLSTIEQPQSQHEADLDDEGDGGSSYFARQQAVAKFRNRTAFISFWADLLATVIASVGSIVALSYAGKSDERGCDGTHTSPDRSKTIAAGVLGFLMSLVTLAINTGLIRYASRIRMHLSFSLADEQVDRRQYQYRRIETTTHHESHEE